MKLYVWVDPYHVSYGSTMVFAVANTEEEARQQVMSGASCSYGKPGSDRGVPRDMALGAPHRIVDCPCAEWHMWQE